MIRNYKLIIHFGVNDIDALVLKESFSSNHFLELKLIYQLEQTSIHIVIFFLFIIRHYKLILLIRINDIDAMVS